MKEVKFFNVQRVPAHFPCAYTVNAVLKTWQEEHTSEASCLIGSGDNSPFFWAQKPVDSILLWKGRDGLAQIVINFEEAGGEQHEENN